MKGLTFKIEPDGVEYKVIDILAPKNSKYQYIIYTDDEEIFASRYTVNKDRQVSLSDVEEEYEGDYIDKRLEEIQNGN